jgi:hypothetical protein
MRRFTVSSSTYFRFFFRLQRGGLQRAARARGRAQCDKMSR